MNKLIRIYNENRVIIIAFVIIIALIIIVIQTLNSIIEKQIEANTIANQETNTKSINNTEISPSNVSVITGEKVQNNELKINVIQQFVKYCNEGKIENAYEMITNDCKQLLYPSLEHFKTVYYDRIFYINRMYTLENWYTNGNLTTYHIRYTEDVLASGSVSSSSMGDYITVVNNSGKNCLNIGNYIGKETLDRTETQAGVTITISSIDLYMDYTIANIKVKNTTNNIICLDSKEEMKTTYLYDTNDVRYEAFLNEMSEEELKIRRNAETEVAVKFNKLYNPESRELNRYSI